MFNKDDSGRRGIIRGPSRPPNICKPCFTRKALFYLFYILGLQACSHLDKKSSAGFCLCVFFKNEKLENPCAWNSIEPIETPGEGRGEEKNK